MWLGDRLLLETARPMEDVEVTIHELWTLSEAGNTLLIAAVVSSPAGKEEIRAAFRKKE